MVLSAKRSIRSTTGIAPIAAARLAIRYGILIEKVWDGKFYYEK